MAVWNIKRTNMIIIFSPVNEWRAIAFARPHKITNVGYVKNIYLQPLAVGWLSMLGCGKVQFEQSFFWGQFQRSRKRLNLKNLLLTLIAVTRINKLVRFISLFKCFEFPIYIFYFRPAFFLRSKSCVEMNNIRKAWRTERSSVAKTVG